MRKYWMCMVLALAGCKDSAIDYGTSARCQDKGFKPGTVEYDRCIKDDKLSTMMEQQRRDFDDMQRARQDEIMRRY